MRYLRAVLRPGLAVVFVAWSVAWAATATPAATTLAFDVTVAGSQSTVVTGVRRTVDDLGCTLRRADAERQTLTFTTRRPGRLTALRGRAASTRVALAVRATGERRRTTTISGTASDCDVAPQTSETTCGPSSFAANATVALPSFGSVRLSGAPLRSRDGSRCTTAAARPRAFLVASAGRFSSRLLTDPTATRIVLRGDARFVDTLASDARRVTTVRWTVTLRRLS